MFTCTLFTDEDFEYVQRDFLEKYWNEFENKEENKLIYMSIFQEYVSITFIDYDFSHSYL